MRDHSKIGTEKMTATRKRFRMSRTIASIDISACPPWPIMSCGVGIAAAARPACSAGGRPSTASSSIGSQMWFGTDRPAQCRPQSRIQP